MARAGSPTGARRFSEQIIRARTATYWAKQALKEAQRIVPASAAGRLEGELQDLLKRVVLLQGHLDNMCLRLKETEAE